MKVLELEMSELTVKVMARELDEMEAQMAEALNEAASKLAAAEATIAEMEARLEDCHAQACERIEE